MREPGEEFIYVWARQSDGRSESLIYVVGPSVDGPVTGLSLDEITAPKIVDPDARDGGRMALMLGNGTSKRMVIDILLPSADNKPLRLQHEMIEATITNMQIGPGFMDLAGWPVKMGPPRERGHFRRDTRAEWRRSVKGPR